MGWEVREQEAIKLEEDGGVGVKVASGVAGVGMSWSRRQWEMKVQLQVVLDQLSQMVK